jgi:dTDP-6-deoxy-L-talose 4-dehydrogenase (NAD+)
LKIAVTGASGFIGKHIVAELERQSIVPVLTSRREHGVHAAGSKPGVVRLDIRNPPEDAFERLGRPDVLIHLAWGGLPHYASLHHFEDELPAHYRFLKGLIAAGLSNLLVAGTCLEYGMQSGQLDEELDARPVVPYGFAKDGLRRELQYLQQTVPFKLTWARLFYLLGDGQAESSLLPLLRSAVSRGDQSFDMSGGEQLRDYLPATEMARILVSLATKARNNGIVNVCSGDPISVRRLVENHIERNGWSIKLNLGYYQYPNYEPMAFWGDRRKLTDCLK